MGLSLRSELLSSHGFRHGFSLRAGGVSQGAFASLNLGRSVGDEPRAVEENHRLFADDVGYESELLYEVTQVHGAGVHELALAAAPELVRACEADALVSARGVIGVRVADCAPVLLADPASGAVAAAHAGWRGLVAGVIEASVARLSALAHAPRSQLIAAVFPCIGPEAFEVGEDVAAAIVAATDESVRLAHSTRPHIDLARGVQIALARSGLTPACIEIVPGCTFGEAGRFFSHRRERGVTGRHLAAIVARC